MQENGKVLSWNSVKTVEDDHSAQPGINLAALDGETRVISGSPPELRPEPVVISKSRLLRRPVWFWQVLIFFSFVVSLAAIVLMLWSAYVAGYKSKAETMDQLLESVGRSIELEMLHMSTYMRTLSVPFKHHSVSRPEFTEVYEARGSTKLALDMYLPIEWAPCVLHSDRLTLEAQSAEYWNISGLRFKDLSGADAPDKAAYVPLLFLEPFNDRGNQAAALFDMTTSVSRTKTMSDCANSGKTVASPPIPLIENSGSLASFLFVPVYKAANEPSIPECEATLSAPGTGIKGFTLAVLHPGDVLLAMVKSAPSFPTEKGIRSICLFQVDDSANSVVMGVSAVGKGLEPNSRLPQTSRSSMDAAIAVESSGSWEHCSHHKSFSFRALERDYSVHLCAEIDGERILFSNQLLIAMAAVAGLTSAGACMLGLITLRANIGLRYSKIREQRNQMVIGNQQVAIESVHSKTEALCNYMNATSHDMRSSIQVLSSASESVKYILAVMLKEEPRNVDLSIMDDEMDSLIASVSMLTMIVNNTMDASLVLAGKEDWAPEPSRVNKLMNDVYGANSAYSKQFRQDVRLSLEIDKAIKQFDEYLLPGPGLLRSLHNLVSNSLKFTKQGEVRIKIQERDLSAFSDYMLKSSKIQNSVIWNEFDSTQDSTPISSRHIGGEAVPSRLQNALCKKVVLDFSIVDTGCGMSEDEQQTCFDAFKRTATENGGGTGLGLFLVRKFFKKCGGSVTVTSELGKGTEFTCILPCYRVLIPTNPKSVITPPLHPAVRPGRRSPLLILIAEDQDINLRTLSRSLMAQGHSVVTAKDGSGLVSSAIHRHGEIDLVIADIDMPGTSGLEGIKSLRDAERRNGWRRMPAIALSGGQTACSMIKAGDVGGFDSVLQKPVSFETLQSVMNKALETDPGQACNRIHNKDLIATESIIKAATKVSPCGDSAACAPGSSQEFTENSS